MVGCHTKASGPCAPQAPTTPVCPRYDTTYHERCSLVADELVGFKEEHIIEVMSKRPHVSNGIVCPRPCNPSSENLTLDILLILNWTQQGIHLTYDLGDFLLFPWDASGDCSKSICIEITNYVVYTTKERGSRILIPI